MTNNNRYSSIKILFDNIEKLIKDKHNIDISLLPDRVREGVYIGACSEMETDGTGDDS